MAGMSHWSDQWDVANAFPAVKHQAMDRVVKKRARHKAENTELLRQRHKQIVITAQDASGRRSQILSGIGGAQGDRALPDQFLGAYDEQVAGFHSRTEDTTFLARGCDGNEVDVGLATFADDMARAGCDRTPRTMLDAKAKWDTEIDFCLSRIGCCQNSSKKGSIGVIRSQTNSPGAFQHGRGILEDGPT